MSEQRREAPTPSPKSLTISELARLQPTNPVQDPKELAVDIWETDGTAAGTRIVSSLASPFFDGLLGAVAARLFVRTPDGLSIVDLDGAAPRPVGIPVDRLDIVRDLRMPQR